MTRSTHRFKESMPTDYGGGGCSSPSQPRSPQLAGGQPPPRTRDRTTTGGGPRPTRYLLTNKIDSTYQRTSSLAPVICPTGSAVDSSGRVAVAPASTSLVLVEEGSSVVTLELKLSCPTRVSCVGLLVGGVVSAAVGAVVVCCEGTLVSREEGTRVGSRVGDLVG